MVRHLVSMISAINPELFASLRKGGNHKKTVELLGEIFLEHHDASLVRDSLAALVHLSNPTFSLSGEARAVLQSIGEKAQANFAAAADSKEKDVDAQFGLSHSLLQLSAVARQIDLGLPSAQFSALKRIVDDSLGGLGHDVAVVRNALETETTEIMWSLAKLLKGTGGSAEEIDMKRDDVLYQLEKLALSEQSDEIVVSAILCATDLLNLFGPHLKKRGFPKLSISCSASLSAALCSGMHSVLDREEGPARASDTSIAQMIDALCKSVKIHTLPISVSANLLVHINGKESFANLIKVERKGQKAIFFFFLKKCWK